MIKRLAQQASKHYSDRSVIEASKQEIYAYGFELLISTIFNLTILLLIACLFGKVLESLLFIIAFIPLRLAAGGYHAKHHWSCILGFNMIFLAFTLFLKWLSPNVLLLYSLIATIVSSITIWCLAPVEAINKPLSSSQRQRQKKHSITLSSVNLTIALICYFVPQAPINLLAYYSSGALSVGFLLIAAKISTNAIVPKSK